MKAAADPDRPTTFGLVAGLTFLAALVVAVLLRGVVPSVRRKAAMNVLGVE